MTKRPAWQYKCDFCGKKMYSGGFMSRHEKHCTANPNRECRVCKLVEGDQRPIGELVDAALRGLKHLEDVSSGCPACMLAAIRRIPIHYPGGFDDGGLVLGDDLSQWKFKSAMKEVWDAVNEKECY